MKSLFILFLLFSAALNLSAQDDGYKTLKNDFDRLRKEEKNDSALLIAKRMSSWALINEGDTSLAYISSFIPLGATFSSLNQLDSAIFYFKFSLAMFRSKKLLQHSRYVDCLNNLDVTFDCSELKPIDIVPTVVST